ncbi:MAG: hypothetical protein R3332_08405 [Pseudohongiellaceae bacterium]|nr:hypothetical protein [Pseudohongiellaceae bacterium]
MSTLQRVERLEMLAMNQALMIKHLSSLVVEITPMPDLRHAQEVCTEEMLQYIFDQNVPAGALELVNDWQTRLNKGTLMQTS